MKAAIYIRVSTQLQATDRQRSELTEYANKQDYQVFKVYEDQMSGFSNDRPSYNQLKEDAKKGLFDIVLFSEMSRMTRKNILLSEVDYFKDLNIQVFFQKQNILITNAANDLGTTILLSVLSAISGYEVALMKERIISGKIEGARKNPMRNGRSPYGYSDIKGKLVIDKVQADHVIDLITKYSNGWAIGDLCAYMRKLTNKPWSASSISKIMKMPIYRGIYDIQFSGQSITKYYPELQILSDELYDAAKQAQSINKRLNKRKTTSTIKENYILNDLIFCPYCGRTIRGKFKSEGNHFYICAGKNGSHRHKGNMCTAKATYNNKYLEYVVWDVVKGASIKENNEVNIKEQLTNIDQLIHDLTTQLDINQIQLNSLDNELNNYIKKAIKYNLPDSSIDEYNSEIQRKKRELGSNINELSAKLVTAKKQQAFLLKAGDETSIQTLLNEAENDVNLKKKYIHEFVDSIIIESIDRMNIMTIKNKAGNGWVVKYQKYQKGLPKYEMTPYVDINKLNINDLHEVKSSNKTIDIDKLSAAIAKFKKDKGES